MKTIDLTTYFIPIFKLLAKKFCFYILRLKKKKSHFYILGKKKDLLYLRRISNSRVGRSELDLMCDKLYMILYQNQKRFT
jgi:hypothetical protein